MALVANVGRYGIMRTRNSQPCGCERGLILWPRIKLHKVGSGRLAVDF